MQLYVFGYGSLMNPRSLALTIPGEKIMMRAQVKGYQRRVNVPYENYLYLNIAPRPGMSVRGVLIPITPEELNELKKREAMYECVDVSGLLSEPVEGTAYTFIAPDVHIPDLKVPRSYLDTCLAGVPEAERDTWLSETIIENEIEDDISAPVYENMPGE